MSSVVFYTFLSPGGSSDADSARFAPGPDGAGAREGGARGGGWPRLQHCADFGETPSAGPGSSGGDLAQPATSGDDSVNQNGSPPPRHSRPARGMGVRSARVFQAKANSGGTRLPRSFLDSTGFQTFPSTLGPNCRSVLCRLPSGEQSPSCKAAAPARP